MKTYLTVTPPGPVTDQVELDIRWTVDAGGVPAREVRVVLTCDGRPIVPEETLDMAPDQIVNRRIRVKTGGLASEAGVSGGIDPSGGPASTPAAARVEPRPPQRGDRTFVLAVSVDGQALPAVSRTVTVMPSVTRSPRVFGGAWVGLTPGIGVEPR